MGAATGDIGVEGVEGGGLLVGPGALGEPPNVQICRHGWLESSLRPVVALIESLRTTMHIQTNDSSENHQTLARLC